VNAELVADRARDGPFSTPGKKRVRRRVHGPAHIDKRSTLWKRIVELRRLFTEASISAGFQVTPLRADLVEQAAAARALAEFARGKFMRGEASDLDDLLRAERRADSLVRRLGLPAEESKPVAASTSASEPDPDLSASELEGLFVLHADPRGLGTPTDGSAGRVTAQNPSAVFPEAPTPSGEGDPA
jgi:hypothetical protein